MAKNQFKIGDWVKLVDRKKYPLSLNNQNYPHQKTYTKFSVINEFLIIRKDSENDMYQIRGTERIQECGFEANPKPYDKEVCAFVNSDEIKPLPNPPKLTNDQKAEIIRNSRYDLDRKNSDKGDVIKVLEDLVSGKLSFKQFEYELNIGRIRLGVMDRECNLMKEVRKIWKANNGKLGALETYEEEPEWRVGDIVYSMNRQYAEKPPHTKFEIVSARTYYSRGNSIPEYELKNCETGKIIKWADSQGYFNFYWLPYKIGDVLQAMNFGCDFKKGFTIQIVKILIKPNKDSAVYKCRFPDGSLKEIDAPAVWRSLIISRYEKNVVSFSFISEPYLILRKFILSGKLKYLKRKNADLRDDLEIRERTEKLMKQPITKPLFDEGEIYANAFNWKNEPKGDFSRKILSIDVNKIDKRGLHKGYATIEDAYGKVISCSIEEVNSELSKWKRVKYMTRTAVGYRDKDIVMIGVVTEYDYSTGKTMYVFSNEYDHFTVSEDKLFPQSEFKTHKSILKSGMVIDIVMNKKRQKNDEAHAFKIEIVSVDNGKVKYYYISPSIKKLRENDSNYVNGIMARADSYKILNK